MMKPVRLYIKQHAITGLMYFGKTSRANVEDYLGSGVRWNHHLKKHGSDFVRTLWVSDPFTDVDLLIDFAQLFSEHFDIVNNSGWANLVVENGVTGGATRTGVVLSEDTKSKLRLKALGRRLSADTKQKMSLARLGKPQTEQQKLAMREYNLNRELPKVTCPHCSKEGSYVAMHRWHFDSCKKKES